MRLHKHKRHLRTYDRRQDRITRKCANGGHNIWGERYPWRFNRKKDHRGAYLRILQICLKYETETAANPHTASAGRE